jgi:hypothetical protein
LSDREFADQYCQTAQARGFPTNRQSAQLLWGLQIASNNLPRKPKPDPKSVLPVTRNKDGVELAPVLKVCNPWLDHQTCEDTESCQVCSDYKAIMGRDEEDGKTLLGTLKLLTSIKESLEQED